MVFIISISRRNVLWTNSNVWFVFNVKTKTFTFICFSDDYEKLYYQVKIGIMFFIFQERETSSKKKASIYWFLSDYIA